MNQEVYVVGVGMTQFKTPRNSQPYTEMGYEAVQAALQDAGLAYEDIQHAYVGYVYGDSTAGQRVLYQLGHTAIPIINVNNNCATGSTALYMARQMIDSGAADCVLALGFEQMVPGALGDIYSDRPSPLKAFTDVAEKKYGDSEVPMAPKLFAGAAREYMEKFGAKPETFAKISVKARKHGAANPKSVFRDPLTLEEVLTSPEISAPITRLQCCPPTCGAAAAILCSSDFIKHRNLKADVRIAGQSMTTDRKDSFEQSIMKTVGYGMAVDASKLAYEEAGIGPEDIDVVELHDCFTANELIAYEALGLTPEGTAEKFIEDGDNTYGGKYVVNPSGGLLSKGHPLGATGLAQCTELVRQLRGEADQRQVEGAKIGLQHNIGLGGCCIVTVYESASGP